MSMGSSITIGSTSYALVNEGNYSGEYRLTTATGNYKFQIAHSSEKATGNDRHVVKMTRTTFATETTPEYTSEAYLVIRNQPADTVNGIWCARRVIEFLNDNAIAVTQAKLDKVINWES